MKPAQLRRALERALLLSVPLVSSGCIFAQSSCPDNGQEPPLLRRVDGVAPPVDQPLDAATCSAQCDPVSEGGVITCAREGERDLLCVVRPPPCEGRRPAGLRDTSMPTLSGFEFHLASAAWLEAASVDAFRQLRCRLRALGAPRRLLRAASRSARDERRHARQSRALARRFGVAPAPVRLDSTPALSVLELAVDNAIEGCVRETWGALIAWHQAEHATERSVRTTMQRIAKDELRHAELAWRLDRFFSARLNAEQRRSVAAARARALGQLSSEIRCELPEPERARLGLPSAERAASMLAELAPQLI